MSRKQTIVPDTLKKKVEAKIAECLKVMDAHYKVKMWRPTVAYDLKGTVEGWRTTRLVISVSILT